MPYQTIFFHKFGTRLVQMNITGDAGTLAILHNADIPQRFVRFFSDLKMGEGPTLGGNATNSHIPLAMIHANLSQLRVRVNDESLFDSPRSKVCLGMQSECRLQNV